MISIEKKSAIEKSVVEVTCVNKSGKHKELGTGFFIDKDVVVTASHVIKNYYEDSKNSDIIITPQKAGIDEDINVKEILNDKNNFIAILKLEKPVENAYVLKFTKGYAVKIDEDYYTFGHPAYKRSGDPIERKVKTAINGSESDRADWDLNINGERAHDFSGYSGAPIIIKDMLVGIMQEQANDSNCEAVSLLMSSMDLMEKYIPENYCQQYNEINKIYELKEKFGEKINSVDEIDEKLRYSTEPSIGLSFFEIDDDEFKKQFKDNLSLDKCYVVGKSREETLYSLLYELNYHLKKRNILVINDADTWSELIDKVSNFILIPNFYVGEIVAIRNNTNIFIYGEDEPCTKDKLTLRRRIKQNIIRKLENAGLDASKAYDFVSKTNGLFTFIKNKLFNGAKYELPLWSKEKNNSIITALLCGKWTECEGDKTIIEQMSGKSYEEFMGDLRPYTKGGEPYIIETKFYGNSVYQLASAETAWAYLNDYLTDGKWSDFKEIAYKTIIEMDPLFNEPFKKHFELSVTSKKPDNSNELKTGMIRTLVFKGILDEKNYQCQVDNIVKDILGNINSVQYWGYIAQFFTDLCEASPESAIKRLENEMKEPTGLKELFNAGNTKDMVTGRHYYTHILWAVEQLLQYKKYAVRAVKWLLFVDDLDLEYSITNSPKSILEEVFCAWCNVTTLTVKQKIQLAKFSIRNYKNSWMMFYHKLPGQSNVCGSLNQPKYRGIDEIIQVTNKDIVDLYNTYADICINNIDGNSDRWIKLIGQLSIFPEKMFNDILEKLQKDISTKNDLDKCSIKDKLRYEISRHREFVKSFWAMPEDKIMKIEKIYENISFEDKVYDYLYLFKGFGTIPLLHPIEYDNKKSYSWEEKRKQVDNVLKDSFSEFKNNGLSLEHLIKSVDKKDYANLGISIGCYYTDEKYDEKIYKMMLNITGIEQVIKKYIYQIYRSCSESAINDVLELSKKYEENNELYIDILRCEDLIYENNPRIMSESEDIKKLFWGDPSVTSFAIGEDKDSIMWALSQFKIYDNLSSYVEYLYYGIKKFEPQEVLNYMKELSDFKKFRYNNVQFSSYHLQEIMSYIEQQFDGKYESYSEIFKVELFLRGIIEWNDMKCTKYCFKKYPELYAVIIDKVFLHEGEEKADSDSEKQKIAEDFFKIYSNVLFCPCENNGNIDYKELKKWVDDFSNILNEQKQSKLIGGILGKLFAYSPVGSDGYYPHESVRRIIEEFDDDGLVRSYVIAECNKRGVYSPDAGKTEKEMALKYKEIEEALEIEYPKTAEIYYKLYYNYIHESEAERRNAEDEW
ncbi:serine protease [Clostridium sp.]|uniref:S1 family peptidase n=1 Tax=Clostridium sp. TaxID=1506 RepID=UPI00257AE5D5|nr:serine protease [Clostridium sp.]MBS4839604.1 trypsin-like peptidase domain-containing protein [Clostridium sp.]MDU1400751.1 serine protease [Clostridium sp.]MDU2893596.1 serine protease [Clostridium sp.]MDU3005545.1 serine protease [Clostridium sp.]MDU3035522.1 serine protease [Clostridium sp.]